MYIYVCVEFAVYTRLCNTDKYVQQGCLTDIILKKKRKLISHVCVCTSGYFHLKVFFSKQLCYNVHLFCDNCVGFLFFYSTFVIVSDVRTTFNSLIFSTVFFTWSRRVYISFFFFFFLTCIVNID